jgi:hypothetical protein
MPKLRSRLGTSNWLIFSVLLVLWVSFPLLPMLLICNYPQAGSGGREAAQSRLPYAAEFDWKHRKYYFQFFIARGIGTACYTGVSSKEKY